MKYGARIIAFSLVTGGLFGILDSLSMGLHFAQQHQNLRSRVCKPRGDITRPGS